MKKETTRQLMAMAVLLILALSSIGYVFSGFGQKQEQPKPLTGFVIDGEIDQRVETTYLQNGFTFLKLYFNENISSEMMNFFTQAPEVFTTSTGQKQLIVQKITGDRNYARLLNMNIDTEIDNLTQDELYTQLCNGLVALPTECAVVGLNLTA